MDEQLVEGARLTMCVQYELCERGVRGYARNVQHLLSRKRALRVYSVHTQRTKGTLYLAIRTPYVRT